MNISKTITIAFCILIIFINLSCQKVTTHSPKSNLIGKTRKEIRLIFGNPTRIESKNIVSDIYRNHGVYFFYNYYGIDKKVTSYCIYTSLQTNNQKYIQYPGNILGFKLGENKGFLKKRNLTKKKVMSYSTLTDSSQFRFKDIEAHIDGYKLVFSLFKNDEVRGKDTFKKSSIGRIIIRKIYTGSLIGGGGK